MVAPSSSLVARNFRVFVVSHVPAREPGCVAFEYSEGNAFFTNIFDILQLPFWKVHLILWRRKKQFTFWQILFTFSVRNNNCSFYAFLKKSRALNVLNQIKQMPKHLEAVHRPPKHLHQTLSKLSTHTFNALGWDEPIISIERFLTLFAFIRFLSTVNQYMSSQMTSFDAWVVTQVATLWLLSIMF